MDLGNSIRRLEKTELIIQSVLWNTLITLFQEKKHIDITPFLISIKIKGDSLLVKTNKPLINTELYLLGAEIEETFQEKLKKLGMYKTHFNIKYI